MTRAPSKVGSFLRWNIRSIRRKSYSLRPQTVVIAVAALAAAGFITGGLYHHFRTSAPEEVAGLPAFTTPATAPRSDKGFSLLETPRPVPELDFVDGEGRELTLTAFEGQTVLLNIWATWCVPCREEMPALDRLEARLGGSDFEVVALSIDRDGLEAVRAFYAELGLKHLAIYLDPSGNAARELGLIGIPGSFLIDREGREVGRLVGPAEWDAPEMVAFIKSGLAGETGSLTPGRGDRIMIAGRADAAVLLRPSAVKSAASMLDLPVTGAPMLDWLDLAR